MAFLVLMAGSGALLAAYLASKLIRPGEEDRSAAWGWIYAPRASWLRYALAVVLIALSVLLFAAVLSVFAPLVRSIP